MLILNCLQQKLIPGKAGDDCCGVNQKLLTISNLLQHNYNCIQLYILYYIIVYYNTGSHAHLEIAGICVIMLRHSHAHLLREQHWTPKGCYERQLNPNLQA